MLRVVSSYKKTIPTKQKYGSESVLISLETEMPSGVTTSELQEKIHAVFKQTQQAVDRELASRTGQEPRDRQAPSAPTRASTGQATGKQIGYILQLGKNSKQGLPELNQIATEQFHAESIYQLSKVDASKLVDQLKAA